MFQFLFLKAVRLPHEPFDAVAVYRFFKIPGTYGEARLQPTHWLDAVYCTEGPRRYGLTFFEKLTDQFAALEPFFFS